MPYSNLLAQVALVQKDISGGYVAMRKFIALAKSMIIVLQMRLLLGPYFHG
jgi:hypothetical protein